MKVNEKVSVWFEASVQFNKMLENGEVKKVTETFAVDALSFSEAEAKAIEEYGCFEEAKVSAIKIASYASVFIPTEEELTEPTYYNVKVAYITLDEKTAKEKRTKVHYLVGASNLEDARKTISEIMSKSMGEWVMTGVTESKVIEVYCK